MLTQTLSGRCCCNSHHFIEEELRLREVKQLSQHHGVLEPWSQNSHARSLALEPASFTITMLLPVILKILLGAGGAVRLLQKDWASCLRHKLRKFYIPSSEVFS